MSKILKSGNMYTIAEIEATYNKLPIGVYNLGLNNRGFYLTRASDFSVPEKIYGDLSPVDRWLKTYNDKKRNVGVLLSGLKGGGKTITAKLLAIKAEKPIITISQPFSGQEFIDFITDPILGDCVIFLDEFEKVYRQGNKDEDGDDSLLSLLDGPYETHHLFIFTVNQTRINSNLINRPSRILYSRTYEGLSENDVIEIANDKLKDKKFMDDLVRTSHKIFQLSFDILISIIDEINRFNEPASKCIEYMNLTPKQVSLNCVQWYIDDDGKLNREYSGWNNNVRYEDDGLYYDCEYHYQIIFPDGRKREDYTSIQIPMDDTKKVSNNTYEFIDDILCSVFTLTENGNDTYGYAGRNTYKPKDVVHPKLTVWVDENSNYIRHIPEAISVKDVSEIIGTRWFNNEKKELLKEEVSVKLSEPNYACGIEPSYECDG